MRRLCFVLLLAACQPQATPSAAPVVAALDGAPVRAATASRQSLVRTVELGGVVAASRSARLVPLGQGVVSALPVKLGDRVKRGQLLAELDVSTLRLQVDQAEKAGRLAHLQLDDARREAERAERLAAEGALAQAQLDKARAGLAMAEAQTAQADASVAVLRDQIGRARLTAPFDGTVTMVALEQGEFFSPTPSMSGPPALVAIDDLDNLQLDLHIADVDLPRVHEGMEAVVRSEVYPERTWAGTVQTVGASAEPGTRTFLVRVRIANDDGALRPGLFLTAALVLERADDAIVVPASAVLGDGDQRWAMVLDGDVARRRAVRVGMRGDAGWQVEDGLTDGETVVTEGHFGLPDGSAVRRIDGE